MTRHPNRFIRIGQARGQLAHQLVDHLIHVLLKPGIRTLGQHVGSPLDQFGAAKILGLLHLLEAVPYGNIAIHVHARRPEIVENIDLGKRHRLHGVIPSRRPQGVERVEEADAWNQTTGREQQGAARNFVVREDAHCSSGRSRTRWWRTHILAGKHRMKNTTGLWNCAGSRTLPLPASCCANLLSTPSVSQAGGHDGASHRAGGREQAAAPPRGGPLLQCQPKTSRLAAAAAHCLPEVTPVHIHPGLAYPQNS